MRDPADLIHREPADLDRRLPGPYFTVEHDPPVTIRVARNPNGTLICTGVLIGWDDDEGQVTSRAIARVRLGAMLWIIEHLDDPDADELRRAAPVVNDVHDLPAWAVAYREAFARQPRSPVKLLAEETGASRATVHRILAQCRDRGILERRYRRVVDPC